MKNEFALSKSDSICKTCGGFGVISLLTGVAMCFSSNPLLMLLGLLLFNFGIVMLTEVFTYLLEISSVNVKFANSIAVFGVGLAIIGAYGLFANTIPAVISLMIIATGNVMMLMQRYR